MSAGLHHPTVWLRWILSNTRRLVVLLVGAGLLGAGLVMLVLPGPGLVVLVVGFSVLATEFAWAERVLDRTKSQAVSATNALTATRAGQAAFVLSALGLLVGGGAVVALADGHRLAGAAAVVSGVAALVVLVPAVQRWMSRASSPSTPSPRPSE